MGTLTQTAWTKFPVSFQSTDEQENAMWRGRGGVGEGKRPEWREGMLDTVVV